MADQWANAKSNHKSIQKLRKIIKSRVWDHPGSSRGRLGDQLGPRAAQASKRAPKGRETVLRFWQKNGDSVQLFVVFFVSVFWGARFADFSWFWVPADPILASILALLWELWAFGKTAESVVRVVNLRGLALARLSLFTGPDCRWVSVSFFCILFMILSCLGGLILRASGLNCCQKGGLKKSRKKDVKRGTRVLQWKPSVGLWVPLRRRKQDIRTSENQKTRQGDQTRPTSLKARWRIY